MLKQGMTPEDMIRYIMLGFDIEFLGTKPIGYHCNCSRERMERAIISLGKQEIRDMIREQGSAEIVCHFCNKAYSFDSSQLAVLIEKSKRD